MEKVETLNDDRALMEAELKQTNPHMKTASNKSVLSLVSRFGPLQQQVRVVIICPNLNTINRLVRA